MSKQMIGGKINLTKIDKSALFKSEKTGAIYLDIIIFFDAEEEDAYGNHGAIIQSYPKDKRPDETLYLGNVKLIVPKGDDAAQAKPIENELEDLTDLPF